MAKVLLTGAAGFIGRHLLRHLADAGHEVDIADFREEISRNFPLIDTRFHFMFIDGLKTVTHTDMSIYDVIVHCGAISSSRCGHDIDLLWERNYLDSIRLATASGMGRQTKFIFFSSASVYGDQPCDGALPLSRKFNPQTEYALTKLAAENALYSSFSESKTSRSLLIVRPFNVYGPDEHTKLENAQSLVYKLHSFQGKGVALALHSPYAYRDFIHVDRLSRAVTAIVSRYSHIDRLFKVPVINLGTGTAHSIMDLSKLFPKTKIEWSTNPYPDLAYQSFSRSIFVSEEFRDILETATIDMEDM
jgi:nucleoside-diphosphate-sugar epimerase